MPFDIPHIPDDPIPTPSPVSIIATAILCAIAAAMWAGIAWLFWMAVR